jgi:hypothetical protein
LEDSFEKQVAYISRTILENLDMINAFFKSDKFDSEMIELRKYVMAQAPGSIEQADGVDLLV